MKRAPTGFGLLRFGRLVVEPPILLLGSDESEVQVTFADGEMITAEEQLRRMMATGAMMDLREGDPTADQPSQGGQWGPEPPSPRRACWLNC